MKAFAGYVERDILSLRGGTGWQTLSRNSDTNRAFTVSNENCTFLFDLLNQLASLHANSSSEC
jgi:hypothetical protein